MLLQISEETCRTTDNVTGATGETFFFGGLEAGDTEIVANLIDATTAITSIYSSTDGESWTDETSAKLYRHYWVGSAWFCSDGTNVFSTTDFSSYTTLASFGSTGEGPGFAGDDDILVAWDDDAGSLEYSTNDGVSFTLCTTQPSATTEEIFHDGTSFWRVDSDSKVYKSADGDTWTDTSAGFTEAGYDATQKIGYDGSNIYVCMSTDGSSAEIKHTDATTTSWSADTPPVAARTYGVVGDGTQVIFYCFDAAYGNCGIYSYSGGSFTLEDSPANTVIWAAILP